MAFQALRKEGFLFGLVHYPNAITTMGQLTKTTKHPGVSTRV